MSGLRGVVLKAVSFALDLCPTHPQGDFTPSGAFGDACLFWSSYWEPLELCPAKQWDGATL